MSGRQFDAILVISGVACAALIALVFVIATGPLAADSPNPRECARIEAVMSDPESSASRGPHAASVLEQAWDDAGCAEVGK